ncbi:MAG: hypothetical protein R2788_11020 [Saprospiraceae bacterium]
MPWFNRSLPPWWYRPPRQQQFAKTLLCNLPPIGQSVQFSGQDLDGGSTAGCNATITSLNASPTSYSYPASTRWHLTVTNSFGLSTCTSTVTVLAPACDNVTQRWFYFQNLSGYISATEFRFSSMGGSGAYREYLWISGTMIATLIT